MTDYYTQFAFAVRATVDEAALFGDVMAFLTAVEDRDSDDALFSADEVATGLPGVIAARFPQCPRLAAEIPERLRPVAGLLSCFEDWQDLHLGVTWRHDVDAGQLVISDEADSPQLYAVCELVQRLFPASLPVAFEYACTANKKVLDGYGGGAILITADGVEEVHTSAVLEDLCAKHGVRPIRSHEFHQLAPAA